jgi:hypothetical protein
MINSMLKKRFVFAMALLVFGTCLAPVLSGADELKSEKYKVDNSDILPFDSQSTSGPLPPPNCDIGLDPNLLTGQTIISGVPSYLWRHGCGPTAAGMVIGYWDGHGYDDLISGDASIQTFLVNQAIASGGNSSNPNPPGSERHYEDYSCPVDFYPNMQQDDYITKGRTPHFNNCLADFMDTSKSTHNNYYGWSWYSDVVASLEDYVYSVNPQREVIVYNLIWGELTWEKFSSEIDANRPVVLLVDTNGDGGTDHFITAIGYDDSNNYACYNTWDHSIHWYDFSKISGGNPWGIYGATFFAISSGKFSLGLIWGNYSSLVKKEKDIIIDCSENNLKILGIGKKSNGNPMLFSSDFTKITTDVFFGLPIGTNLIGIILNSKIF